MLVSVPPHLAPAKLVLYLKGRSSRLLQDEFPADGEALLGPAPVGAVDEGTHRGVVDRITCKVA